jgi:hypothetical protein
MPLFSPTTVELQGQTCAMDKFSKSSITSAGFPVARGEVVCLYRGGIASYVCILVELQVRVPPGA